MKTLKKKIKQFQFFQPMENQKELEKVLSECVWRKIVGSKRKDFIGALSAESATLPTNITISAIKLNTSKIKN